jgi:hypothetical protein
VANTHPEIGVCGLSCRLCPSYHTEAESRCLGCTSAGRMAVGCPFITCAVKRKGLAGCWACPEGETCAKWQAHRAAGREHDSFVCYQRLDDNIAYLRAYGAEAFAESQREREALLREMLSEFNDGRSKRLFCVAATVMTLSELEEALAQARLAFDGTDAKLKARALRTRLEEIAQRQGYHLALRK